MMTDISQVFTHQRNKVVYELLQYDKRVTESVAKVMISKLNEMNLNWMRLFTEMSIELRNKLIKGLREQELMNFCLMHVKLVREISRHMNELRLDEKV